MDLNKDLSYAWGDPVVFKDIKLYPVKMKDCLEFYNCVGCLLIEKNHIQDARVIRMSYLEFLLTAGKQDERILESFIGLIKLVLREQEAEIKVEMNRIVFIVRVKADGVEKIIEVSGKEFDRIRMIILNQNLIKFDEELMNLETKRALEEAQTFMAKRKKTKQATIEEQIVAYHCAMGLNYSDIKELSIFQFNKGLERKSLMLHVEMMSTALATGMASTQEEVPTWLDHISEKGKYDDIKMSEEDFKELTSDKELFKNN